jgi:hypothetical protein
MSPEPTELKQALARTQESLEQTLAEACDPQVSKEDTGELIRLEELLNDAATSAKEAISLRRRLGAERDKDELGGPRPAPEGRAPASDQPVEAEKLRELRDVSGREWRVWEVAREQLERARPGTYAGEFEGGWLCFEAADGGERRRLPAYPSNWRSLTRAELETLLAQARPAARRRGAGGRDETERGAP